MDGTSQCCNITCMSICVVAARENASYGCCNFTCMVHSSDCDPNAFNVKIEQSVTLPVIVLGVIIILVNIPLLHSLIMNKRNRQNMMKMHQLSLSPSDICVGVMFVVAATQLYLDSDIQDITHHSCYFSVGLSIVSSLNSKTQILLICTNRLYLFIKMRHLFENIKTLILMVILVVFICAISVLLPIQIFATRLDTNDSSHSDSCVVPITAARYISIMFTVIGLAILVCYSILIYKLCHHYFHRRKVFPTRKQTLAHGPEVSSRKYRSVMILGFMVIMQFITMMPNLMIMITHSFELYHYPRILRILFLAFAALQSAINPMFYIWMYPSKPRFCCTKRINTQHINLAS